MTSQVSFPAKMRIELLRTKRNTQLLISHRLRPKTENASRRCDLDGRWDNYTNYDLCQHVVVPEFEPGIELPTIIYYTGYTISLVSLSLAVAVFFYFK